MRPHTSPSTLPTVACNTVADDTEALTLLDWLQLCAVQLS
jgi:hypothetical protein